MSFFYNELQYLQRENRLRREALSEDSNRWIDKLMRRLLTARVGQFERARVEKELIGKALKAESQGRACSGRRADEEAFLESILTGQGARVGEMLLDSLFDTAKMFFVYSIIPFILELLDSLGAPERFSMQFWTRGALEYMLWMIGLALITTLMMLIADLFALHPRIRIAVVVVLVLAVILLPIVFFTDKFPRIYNQVCVGTVLLSAVWLIGSRLLWNAHIHAESERLEWRD